MNETKGFLKLIKNECVKGRRLIPIPHDYAMDLLFTIDNLEKEVQELRQENIMLHEINDQHRELNGELRERIEKAIKLIEEQMPVCIMPNNTLIHGTEKAKVLDDLLTILKGEIE